MKNMIIYCITLLGLLLSAGCTIQETPFAYTTAQAELLERLSGNVYLAEDPEDEAQTATLALDTLYMPPYWVFTGGRGFTVYGIMKFSKFTWGEINDDYPLDLCFNLNKEGDQMALAIAPDFEMLGKITIDFPSETSLRMTLESFGEMLFEQVDE
ncbi:MAG: hypothetical protein PHV69_01175 [Bacteroidales bacterium]|jgi:hypothetical protein|nr:hypothetical protein [Bacteroidales bacterium]MDD4168615.1 hypothetical protein [Bacteroidales bacterium]MDD5045691.1 hypothetical protein [Bacteroidales bacterium]HHV04026.1 hypothetical protein [Bacteroidales bacterium]